MSDPDSSHSTSAVDDGSSTILWEIAAMAGSAYLLVLTASITAQFVPLVSQYLYLIVAVVFVGLPLWWLERNEWKFERFALAAPHLWRDTTLGLALAAVTAVPFAAGFWVWETYAVGSTYTFEWENYQRWDPKLEGEPSNWGEQAGAWIWTEERDVHVGLRAGSGAEVPWRLKISADRPFALERTGQVAVKPAPSSEKSAGSGPDFDGRASAWIATVREPHRKAELTVKPAGAGTSEFPTSLTVESLHGRYPLHRGAGAQRLQTTSFTTRRGYSWVFLWLMTQLLFIALPEEYFYRGYLQTRLREYLVTRRQASDRESEEATRSLLGISEENVLASVVFGIGHLLTPVGGAILWNRIGVVAPSIAFGWLRDRTDSIVAPVVYHASCNMLVLFAEPHFF